MISDISSSFWTIGIDPGRRGAIAAMRSDHSEFRILKMPMLEKAVDTVEIRQFLTGIIATGNVRHAILEKAQVMPSQGAISGFTYGRNYGVLLTCLEFMGIPFTETSPSKWKLAIIGAAAAPSPTIKTSKTDSFPDLDVIASKSVKASHKKVIKELAILTARRMFPAAGPFTKTEDGPAEAILMAEAARRLILHGSMNGIGKQLISIHEVTV